MHASVDGYLCIVCECVSKPKSMRNLFLDIAESIVMFGLLVNYESTKLSRLMLKFRNLIIVDALK